ncbi:putative serpin-like protein TK1782 [Araneus ventricosus]|uniref:Putative serpin-like protein TK1782 n=1 Tax=Araneus ventricosus TaxID=182803 RepID=A0A4Y2TU21_ARAVE|nr:putative serpin-like protein TK1782 [Araneus ventricosus]
MDSSVAEASNHLGINLYKLLAKENTNVFFSPFSISTALAMLFCGAENETAEEMRKVLGYEVANIKDEELKLCFQKLLDALDSNQESYTLNYANTVLSHKEFSVKEEYKSLLEDFFKALFQETDFINENEKAVKLVNEWVNEKTNNMIPKLLDSLDPSTVMIILNAVYFKGLWLHPFDEKSTFLQYFYNKGDEEELKQVDMMHLKEKFPYVEKESYKALQLPYKGDDISMLILLPNSKDGLSELENSLSSTFIQDIKQSMRERKVEVALPKFKLEYSKSLKEKFQSLGLNQVFNVGAHLNGINDSGNLLVSEIIHKAVLVVNEEGSEAAAVTAVMVMMCALTFDPEFIVDHPFMFVIYNNKNNLILFMGRVDEL